MRRGENEVDIPFKRVGASDDYFLNPFSNEGTNQKKRFSISGRACSF